MPKGEVDPVLENLIIGMLATHFDDRFSIRQIKEHDWLKKKHPMDAPSVTITPRDPDDPMMSTSVIPYLVDLHFGEEEATNHEIADNELVAYENHHPQNGNRELKSNLITEHDLREQARIREAERQERLLMDSPANMRANAADNTGRAQHSQHGRNKTTKCIKVKKMSNCSVS